MIVDTLIVQEENGMYKIERYNNQNLDEYNYIAELNHEKLFTCKINNDYYMKTISIKDIMDYLVKEFNYKAN